MMEFKFKLGYRHRAVYEILDWGKPWHGKCVAFYGSAPNYSRGDGKPAWSYSQEEFERAVLDVVGYLYWDICAFDDPPPMEWVGQLNAMFYKEFELARQKYPDVSHAPCSQLKGVAQYSLEREGWIKFDYKED